MKTSIPVILFALLACAGMDAGAKQARVIVECSASHDDCVRKPAKSTATPAAKREVPALPPDTPGDARMGMMAGPMMTAPPSLAAPSMPPSPAAPLVAAEVPESAHAACARKKNGSKLTVRLSPQESVAGICKKKSGKMRFQARQHHVG